MNEFFRLLFGTGIPQPSLEHLRLQGLIFEELHRLRTQLLQGMAIRPEPGAGAGREDPREERVLELLRRAQFLLLQYPVAAQAAFSSLVAEGRRFAATPEGKPWVDALASSELVRRGGQLWEATALSMLEESPDSVIPSHYLEALLWAVRSPGLEQLLNTLHGASGGQDGPAR